MDQAYATAAVTAIRFCINYMSSCINFGPAHINWVLWY